MKGSMEGKRFGNYIAFEVLGRGGMGTVYLAEHPEIKRRVAIKVLNRTHKKDIVDRFLAEATAVNRIGHPNIIDIYDFGRTASGRVYYVMEYLKGRELSEIMTEHQRMTPPQILPYIQQICAALQAAHEADVVHRDLKPENIFVADGEPMQLKVLDFGIAKLLDAPSDSFKTSPGTVLGTPMFSSPEQAGGELNKIGPQSDLYSLGVILYWMLTGRPPFMADSMALLLAMHMSDPPRPIRDIVSTVPKQVAEWVERCLAKKPEDRPESAKQLVEAFATAAGESQAGGVSPTGTGGLVFVPEGPVDKKATPGGLARFRTTQVEGIAADDVHLLVKSRDKKRNTDGVVLLTKKKPTASLRAAETADAPPGTNIDKDAPTLPPGVGEGLGGMTGPLPAVAHRSDSVATPIPGPSTSIARPVDGAKGQRGDTGPVKAASDGAAKRSPGNVKVASQRTAAFESSDPSIVGIDQKKEAAVLELGTRETRPETSKPKRGGMGLTLVIIAVVAAAIIGVVFALRG